MDFDGFGKCNDPIQCYSYFTNEAYKESITNLGYSQYFKIQLAVAKMWDVISPMSSSIHARLKEWAYAGLPFLRLRATKNFLSMKLNERNIKLYFNGRQQH